MRHILQGEAYSLQSHLLMWGGRECVKIVLIPQAQQLRYWIFKEDALAKPPQDNVFHGPPAPGLSHLIPFLQLVPPWMIQRKKISHEKEASFPASNRLLLTSLVEVHCTAPHICLAELKTDVHHSDHLSKDIANIQSYGWYPYFVEHCMYRERLYFQPLPLPMKLPVFQPVAVA